MGQDTEVDSDEGGQDLLPRPWSKGAAHYPDKWLAGWSLAISNDSESSKSCGSYSEKILLNFSNDP